VTMDPNEGSAGQGASEGQTPGQPGEASAAPEQPTGVPFQQPEPPTFESIPPTQAAPETSSVPPAEQPAAVPPPPAPEPPPVQAQPVYTPPPVQTYPPVPPYTPPPPPPAYGPLPGQGAYAPPPGYAAAQPGFPPPIIAADQTFGPRLQRVWSQMMDVVLHPSVERLSALVNWGDWALILVLLVGLGLLEGIVGTINSQIYGAAANALLNSGQLPENARVFLSRVTPTQSFADIITVPIAFFIGAGFFWLVARIFGGQGTFLQHSWLLALVYVPITAATTVLSLIPVLGPLVGFGLGIYGIVLSIFAIAAAHRMSVGKSAAVVLIPGAIVLLLVICAFVALVAIFAGSTLGR
jgi:hypothetical protein